MKTFRIFLAVLPMACTAPAAVFYSGIQNVPVPLNFDGVYLNIFTGLISLTQPPDWNTAPWINPFFGGVDIGNDALLRPVITGADQVVNVAFGAVIDGTGNFAAGESGSSTHVGAAAGQFAIGTPGFLGFVFNQTTGGPDYYGWLDITLNNTGSGLITDWAYDDTGSGIKAGSITPVPEPGAAMLLALGAVACALRRRRK